VPIQCTGLKYWTPEGTQSKLIAITWKLLACSQLTAGECELLNVHVFSALGTLSDCSSLGALGECCSLGTLVDCSSLGTNKPTLVTYWY
jgi:hypothetical protein